LVVASTMLATVATAILAAASPAAASPTTDSAPQVSWAYTDSREEDVSHVNPTGDVPLGAWNDDNGKRHISRVYATYDLSRYAAKHILVANLFAQEAKASDCQQRQIDVWQTAPSTNPTWDESPEERVKLGTISGTTWCPATLKLELTDAVRRAANEGRSRLTIELRVPKDREKDPALGRWLSGSYGLRLSVESNTPPQTPTRLYNSARPCTDQTSAPYLSGLTPSLSAMFNDPDDGDRTLTGEFEIWPVDQPDQRTVLKAELASNGWVSGAKVPAGRLADNVTYAWAARVSDGTDTSAWSKTCYFITDATAPASAPGVSAPEYPDGSSGPGGVPGRFTFTPSGVSDVAAYQYSWGELGVPAYGTGPYNVPQWTDPFDGPQFVRAASLGASATISLSPPSGGPNRLKVRSYDRAGNSSGTTTYQIYVGDTSPTVTVGGPITLGTAFTMRFVPGANVSGVLDYTYKVDYGPEQTVAAGADGGATVTLTLSNSGSHNVDVRSRSANGWVSSPGNWHEYVDTSPSVTSAVYPEGDSPTGGVGVAGTFTFAPRMPNVVAYVFSFDWGVETTVAAGADGKATITWTPDSSGYHDIQVYAKAADGTLSDPNYNYYFTVSNTPAS
jgi:hypothetical protein